MASRRLVLLSLLLLPLVGAGAWMRMGTRQPALALPDNPIVKPIFAATPVTTGGKIVVAAREQIGDNYAAGYVSLDYPNGDVPKGQGACTDVVVRSLRRVGVDLQKVVHEDMKANFAVYPPKWGLSRPDSNIDHRRVPNLQTFFRRKGAELSIDTRDGANWKPGDIVTWKLASGLDHCGVVTDKPGPSGLLQVVHNLGPCLEADCLATWKITGHYRYPKSAQRGK